MEDAEPRILGPAVGHRRARRRWLRLPAVWRVDRARPARSGATITVPRGRLRLRDPLPDRASRRARLPVGPRLIERDVPAAPPRAHRPHRRVHADGPATLSARVFDKTQPDLGDPRAQLHGGGSSVTPEARGDTVATEPRAGAAGRARGWLRHTRSEAGARGGQSERSERRPDEISNGFAASSSTSILLLPAGLFWPPKNACRVLSPDAGST